MDTKIAQANIDRFELMLKTEVDSPKRVMILRLLEDEREKLKASKKSHQKLA
jgi:hypothetical protein